MRDALHPWFRFDRNESSSSLFLTRFPDADGAPSHPLSCRVGFRPENALKKKKGPTRVGPCEASSCDRPDPDDPGGLGAEESGTERTGPTHNVLSQSSRAGGWRKWGGIMIPLT